MKNFKEDNGVDLIVRVLLVLVMLSVLVQAWPSNDRSIFIGLVVAISLSTVLNRNK